MKQKVRKALAISGMAIVVGTSGIAHTANAYNPERKTFAKNEYRNNKEQSKTWQEHRGERRGSDQELRREEYRKYRGIRMTPGVVTAITDTTITIKRGERVFSVSTTNTTKYIDRKWNSIVRTDIKVGDKIRVRGTVTENTITAKHIRNISLPKNQTAETN